MAGNTTHDPDLEPDDIKGYKVSGKKTIDELKQLDTEDESLKRYKEALLGSATKTVEPPFPNDPRNLIVDKLCICVEGQNDLEVSLRGDLCRLKESPIPVPEGSKYRVKLVYYVQREIVCGLRYVQATYRKHLRVDKDTVMLGSYGPRAEPHVWISDVEEAPKGQLARGTYNIKSRFTDDDKATYLTWEWAIQVVKLGAAC